MNTEELQSLLCCPPIQSPDTQPFDPDLLVPSLSSSEDNFNMENKYPFITTSPNINPILSQPSSISCSYGSEPISDPLAIDAKVTECTQKTKNRIYQQRYNQNLRKKRKSQQEQIVLLRNENSKLMTKLELTMEKKSARIKDLMESLQSLHCKIDKIECSIIKLVYAIPPQHYLHV